MAKIKNVGDQPRGFFTDQGDHVVIEPGDEAEFNMTEADFNKLKELNEAENAENPPLEIGGSFGGVKAKQGARDPASDPLSQMQREKEATQKQAVEEEKKAEERAKMAEKAEKAEGKTEREPERETHKKR